MGDAEAMIEVMCGRAKNASSIVASGRTRCAVNA